MNQQINIATDAVVFGYSQANGLQVLLIKRNIPPFENAWALPGGLVQNEESLEQAVERELREETGLAIDYLEQLYTFGQPGRDPRNRVVSVAYYALVRPDKYQLQADTDAKEAQWFNVQKVPTLAFDHAEILKIAIQRLRGKIVYEPIGFELLDKHFTLGDLRHLYESILDRPIDRGNFRRKILRLGLLEEVNKAKTQDGAGRPATILQFNEKRYFELLKKGFTFEITLESKK